MCWRIVRTEADGSVRLILEDDAAECNDNEGLDQYTGTWNVCNGKGISEQWFSNDEDWANCNYGLGLILDSECGPNEYLCGSNLLGGSTMEQFSAFEKSLFMIGGFDGTQHTENGQKLKRTKLCYGDKSKFYDDSGKEISEDTVLDLITNYYESSEGAFNYSNVFRYLGIGQNKSASFDCHENGISTESYIIFPITADEIIFAGGKMGDTNRNFYFYNGKEYGEDIWGGFFTQSISHYDGFFENAVYFANGSLGMAAVDSSILARPAISLVSSVEYKSGNGSIENPYVIR